MPLFIRIARVNAGVSQTNLAVVARVAQPTLSLIEQGRLQPTAAQLRRLADALDINPPERLLEHVTLVTTERS